MALASYPTNGPLFAVSGEEGFGVQALQGSLTAGWWTEYDNVVDEVAVAG